MEEPLMPIDLQSAFATPPQRMDYVFGNLVAGTVGALVAPGGTGKSFWALETAMAIACDVEGGDLINAAPAKTGSVVYLALEDSEQVLAHRIYAIGQNIRARCLKPTDASKALEAIARNLKIEPMMGKRLDLMTDQGMQIVSNVSVSPRLIILDTVSRAHQLDENSNRDMSLLVSRLEELAVTTGAAVLFIHHVSKASRRDGTLDQYSSRGASALIDNARWCGYLAQMTEDEAKLLIDGQDGIKTLTGLRRQYVRFGENKLNYGPSTFQQRWYERVENGVLLPASLSEVKSRPSIRSSRKGRESANASSL
jgi:RecA-family ATPase